MELRRWHSTLFFWWPSRFCMSLRPPPSRVL